MIIVRFIGKNDLHIYILWSRILINAVLPATSTKALIIIILHASIPDLTENANTGKLCTGNEANSLPLLQRHKILSTNPSGITAIKAATLVPKAVYPSDVIKDTETFNYIVFNAPNCLTEILKRPTKSIDPCIKNLCVTGRLSSNAIHSGSKSRTCGIKLTFGPIH